MSLAGILHLRTEMRAGDPASHCKTNIHLKRTKLVLFIFRLEDSKPKKLEKNSLRRSVYRLTSVGTHLRVLAPGQNSSEERSLRWRAVGDTVSKFSHLGLELQTSRTDSDFLATELTDRVRSIVIVFDYKTSTVVDLCCVV